MSDFQADLTELENGVNTKIQPAVEHFRAELEKVDDIRDYSSRLSNGASAQNDVVALYQTASNALLDRQRTVVRSLEDFRDTLKDIIRTYRTVEESNANTFRGDA